jgi:ketosteroid isomerase-like protein
VAAQDRLQVVRDMYVAFAAGDREVIERTFAGDFAFSSPVDVDLDREGYFERCWPGAGRGQEFDFVRQIESGDEVVVTYEATRPAGEKARNTEILTFRGEQICRVEVYFGWNVPGD